MILSDELKRIIKLVSIETKIPESTVEVVYRDYWKFVRDTFENLPLKSITSEEEFNNLKTSINLPGLGKIYTTFDKVEKYQKRTQYVKQIFNK
jgi:hypothetical protein